MPQDGTDNQAAPADGELRALLKACDGGEQTALKSLYRLTSARVFPWVQRMIDDPDAAEQVLKDTYIAVWRHAGVLATRAGSPLGWIKQTARAQSRHYRSAQTTLPDTPLTAGAPSTGTFAQKLSALDEATRSTLLSTYCHGVTVETLAQVRGTTSTAVREQLQQGLSRLQAPQAGEVAESQWVSLAGEYVLGTLPDGEQRIYDAIVDRDADFGARVARWQQTLSVLDETIDMRAPDYRAWQQIAAGLLFDQPRRQEPDDQPSAKPVNEENLNSRRRPTVASQTRATGAANAQPASTKNRAPESGEKTASVSDTRDATLDQSLNDTRDTLTQTFDNSDLSERFYDDSGHFPTGDRPFLQRPQRRRHKSGAGFLGFVCGAAIASLLWWQKSEIQYLLAPYLPSMQSNTVQSIAPDFVGVVEDRQGQAAWVVSADLAARTLHVVAVHPPGTADGEVHELWLVKAQQSDWLSAGLLTSAAGQSQTLSVAGLRDDVAEFVVSTEPPGGSTRDRPSSEILYRGDARVAE